MATTRQRVLDATTDLFLRYGYNGTGLKQIVAEADAPFGSVYHFFPGGKRQLGEEVVRRSGQIYLELVVGVLAAAEDLVQGVEDIFCGAAEVLRATGYADVCPIGTVALEVAGVDEALRVATAEVFQSWIDAAAAVIQDTGVSVDEARSLASAIIALLEGAFMLSRSMRSTDPMDAAGQAAVVLARAALVQARSADPVRRRRSR